jgi:hypothetical protein
MPHPTYWIRQQLQLGTTPGHHRFVWNLRYKEPRGANRGFAIAAVKHNTSSGPVGPYVHPGKYIIRLKVDEEVLDQTIDVRLDPRISATEQDIQLQTRLSINCYQLYEKLQLIREQIDLRLSNTRKWKKGERQLNEQIRGSGEPDGGDMLYGSIRSSSLEEETIVGLQEKFLFLLTVLQSADERPTSQLEDAFNALETRAGELVKKWEKLK